MRKRKARVFVCFAINLELTVENVRRPKGGKSESYLTGLRPVILIVCLFLYLPARININLIF